MRVGVTARAAQRVGATVDAFENQRAAQRFKQRLAAALRRIRDWPKSGHLVAETPKGPVRQLVVDRYRLFYLTELRRNMAWVLDFVHVAQDFKVPEVPAELG